MKTFYYFLILLFFWLSISVASVDMSKIKIKLPKFGPPSRDLIFYMKYKNEIFDEYYKEK